MSEMLCRRLIGGVMAAGLLGGVAYAQNEAVGPMRAPPEGSLMSGVEVSVPRTIEQNRDGVTVQVVTMSVHVPYKDLDMRTPAGVAELNKRVTRAADYVCTQLANMYPNGYPEKFYCQKEAVNGSQPQVIQARAGG